MRDRPTPVNRSIWTCRRSNDLIYAANLQMSRATGTVPERVQSRVHTTEPTGPVPEPFHCDHIARWSTRSGTTGRSGTGLNTGDWNGSGTVPVPNLWCEHGLTSPSEGSLLQNESVLWVCPPSAPHQSSLMPCLDSLAQKQLIS